MNSYLRLAPRQLSRAFVASTVAVSKENNRSKDLGGSPTQSPQNSSKFPPSRERALASVKGQSFMDISRDWATLRLMRIKALEPIATELFEMSKKPADTSGKIAQQLLKAFMSRFCSDLPLNELFDYLETRGILPDQVIVDFPLEQVSTLEEAERTFAAYESIAKDPKVKFFAIKISGIIPVQYLKAGDLNCEVVQNAISRIRGILEIAKAGEKVGVFDAENFSIEGSCFAIAKMMSDEFGTTAMLTLQATRKDSIARLLALCEDATKPRSIKLVCGTYHDDWTTFEESFQPSPSATHDNFRAILSEAKMIAHLSVLPCSHNPDLCDEAISVLGHRAIGHLFGMHGVASLISDDVREKVYMVVGDFKDSVLYFERRWKEHSGTLVPRRETILFLAMQQMILNASEAIVKLLADQF